LLKILPEDQQGEGAMIEEVNLHLKPGDKDSIGNTVERVVAKHVGKKYAVWISTDGRVYVDADDETIVQNPEVAAWTVRVSGLIRSRKAFEGQYNTYLGHAYKLACEGNLNGALEALKRTYDQISGRLTGESRLLYLTGALIVTAVCELICTYLFFFISLSDLAHRVAAGLAMAVLGGFMSVAAGLHKQTFELPESRLLLLAYGSLRLIVALLAGVVAVLMINTGVALSFLLEHNEFGGILLACFLAGFSERLITNSLRQIETTAG
jgi:hypothetical protein